MPEGIKRRRRRRRRTVSGQKVTFRGQPAVIMMTMMSATQRPAAIGGNSELSAGDRRV